MTMKTIGLALLSCISLAACGQTVRPGAALSSGGSQAASTSAFPYGSGQPLFNDNLDVAYTPSCRTTGGAH